MSCRQTFLAPGDAVLVCRISFRPYRSGKHEVGKSEQEQNDSLQVLKGIITVRNKHLKLAATMQKE